MEDGGLSINGSVFDGKTVLVTGAGGSIGSALAERVSRLGCGMLVLLDHSEYLLYEIDRRLDCLRLPALGDCKDFELLRRLPPPDFVFHCAAYKHVPMLEGFNSRAAYANNVIGTECVMDAFGAAERIVLLSTDKAINPVSAMGKSKKAAEAVTLRYGRTVGRLGNILESSGSVVPLFREQIAKGGPVTVTHPEATRYFLTMDAACDFLLSLAAKEPGVYQAPMGEPQNILEIAKRMIGDRHIPIQFIGLRAGEKLHEELEAA